MDSINFHDSKPVNPIKTTELESTNNDKDSAQTLEPKEAIEGSSIAFERPGLAHAQRYTEIQKAMEESAMKDLPEQFDSAKQIEALRNDNLEYQIMIKESTKTTAIVANGISSIIGALGKVFS